MDQLGGIHVALLEGRRTAELEELIRRYGGNPVCAPAVREERRPAAAEVLKLLETLTSGPQGYVLFSTGVGVKALFEEGRLLGQEAELRAALRNSVLIGRGPKPVAALHKEGFQVGIRVNEPYTRSEVLDALEGLDLTGKWVGVVHHGERNLELVQALERRGARLAEVMPYEWKLPVDTAPLQAVIRELVEGHIEAVAFTSQVQVRYLFQVAEGMQQKDSLLSALRRITLATVGPTCTATLRSFGCEPQVVPEHPKMGDMVAKLAKFTAARKKT